MRKTRDKIVTTSKPASPKATNSLQNTTELQQLHDTTEIVTKKYANIKCGNQNLREVSKITQDACEPISFWKKNLVMFLRGAPAKKYLTETTKNDE